MSDYPFKVVQDTHDGDSHLFEVEWPDGRREFGTYHVSTGDPKAYERERSYVLKLLAMTPDQRKRQLGVRVLVSGHERRVTSIRRDEDVLGLEDGSFVNASGVELAP